ncbi:hypothetical protein Bca52824_000883 [Brassica carinata]|uniref:SUI1 domain-containing protein n=1 Tax=Brassica carinata TaxID=52824 RepID=A0A8X7WF26_BRACI|nr:hypothetical protein Bca52824_000883 [Brassica carinata]
MSEVAILGFLKNNESIPDSGEFAAEHNPDHEEVKIIIKSLQGFRYIEAKELKRETLVLTDDGKKFAAEGSPEIHFFSAIPEEGSISKDDLEKKLDPSVFKIESTQAAKKRWVAMGKQVSRKVQHVEDKVKESLLQIQQGLVYIVFKAYLLSFLIRGWTRYSYVEKGPNYAPKRKIFAIDLTRENLHNWKELEFKEYNFNAKGQPLDAGHLHPLLKVSASLFFCPSDQQSFMSELDSQVPTAFDPFDDANAEDSGAGTKEYVHIRVQQRNGRKSLTTVQGLKKEYIYSKILKDFKKEFCCNINKMYDTSEEKLNALHKELESLKSETPSTKRRDLNIVDMNYSKENIDKLHTNIASLKQQMGRA